MCFPTCESAPNSDPGTRTFTYLISLCEIVWNHDPRLRNDKQLIPQGFQVLAEVMTSAICDFIGMPIYADKSV